MTKSRTEHIIEFLHKVMHANKELPKKEAFKDLLNRLYAGDETIENIIDKISLGSETAVLNIPRQDKVHRGSADTLYNNIIIEFENNLTFPALLEHAKEQLAGYFLGQVRSGKGFDFTLIATDCERWYIYVPDVDQLENLEELKEDELILNEVKSSSFVLCERNAEDFYFWIDRFLFKEEKRKATLKSIEESFGYQSNVFLESFRLLSNYFSEAKKYGEVQVAYEEWEKYLSIAYGSFKASEKTFLIHTYLSIFSKMLAYSVLSNDDYIDDDEMKAIISGKIFFKYGIQNFIDNDFYHWVGTEKNFREVKKVFRLIAQEVSSFDFFDVDEDILKGVYQELIDLDTRHTLGEYYTPDWLCERMLKEFDFKPTDKVLDPACGSGSFLRAFIHRFRELNPDMKVEQINANVYGIDIHPLSVQIAKTTVLLAFGKEISKIKKPIHLNVILANTLRSPVETKDLFSREFLLTIDKHKLWLSMDVFDEIALFDDALDACDDLAESTLNGKSESLKTIENIISKKKDSHVLTDSLIASYHKIYEALKSVKESGRDGIWKFIIQNTYKPFFLSGKFNYVIGNPPWFTYSSIGNEEYQDLLNRLAVQYDLKPAKVANYPHLEIAAIFMSHCSSYFLSDKGELAFVLPRSFFNADHHDNTRCGKAKGFEISGLWDLEGVSPLFRIPSCVLFSKKSDTLNSLPEDGADGIAFKGNLPAHNCNLETVKDRLTENKAKYYYIKQGKSSAFSTRNAQVISDENPYKALFRQGATIVPRAFYFIDLEQETPDDWDDRIINIKTSEDIQTDAKVPWKGLNFSGKIESKFIFRTALSKNILPFALHEPVLVTLPITIYKAHGEKKILLHSADELLSKGYLDASRWFKNAENIWDIHKTENNQSISASNYLNWQNKMTEQNLNAQYIVLYNSSAKDANATVVKKSDLDLEFVAESVTYILYTNDINEAYYLAAILNSEVPNLLMKDFQSRGLFGARHVHKKILDIYYPKYNEKDAKHKKLAKLSEDAHRKASEYLKTIDKAKKIQGLSLGKLRLDIKKHLEKELKEIDEIVKGIVG